MYGGRRFVEKHIRGGKIMPLQLEIWINCLTKNQLYIIKKMLRNGMVMDLQQREIIEYALSEQRLGSDP
ncbi:hypothetical protein RhiirC2_802206 [Rhizophagus irregularis]|uniref:Uncharacterized protein n=1 Tax=Rhizophagus irregularis TaxID=588596 RepID=A0A2N1M1L2_9GLOM|nr:hypothetical protein RhiirC2_802206 [Rhizophagus irregularis]